MSAGSVSDTPGRDSPTRQSRGRQRIRQILDAAVRLIGTGGLSALTHRALAEAAGVPLGSTTYYFADRDELIRRTMEHAVEIEAERLAAVVDGFDGQLTVDTSVALLAEMFFDKTVADPLYDLALFEMFLEATRNPAVRDLTLAWSDMIAGLTDRVLPPTDPAVPRAQAVQIVATLIDGLMLEEASNQTLGLARLSDQLRVVVARLCIQP